MSRSRVVLTSLMGWLVYAVPIWAKDAGTSAPGAEVLYERHVAPLLSRLGCTGDFVMGLSRGREDCV